VLLVLSRLRFFVGRGDDDDDDDDDDDNDEMGGRDLDAVCCGRWMTVHSGLRKVDSVMMRDKLY